VVALVRTLQKGKEVEALGAKAVVADALDNRVSFRQASVGRGR
jgi:hypothetical protein